MQMQWPRFQYGDRVVIKNNKSYYWNRNGGIDGIRDEHVRVGIVNDDSIWFHKDEIELIPEPHYVYLKHRNESLGFAVPKEVYDELLEKLAKREEEGVRLSTQG